MFIDLWSMLLYWIGARSLHSELLWHCKANWNKTQWQHQQHSVVLNENPVQQTNTKIENEYTNFDENKPNLRKENNKSLNSRKAENVNSRHSFPAKKKAKTVASLSRLCHMAKSCANKVIKSRKCYQKSQSITEKLIKILNNNDVAPKINYALFAYRYECRALESHSRIPIICRFYTLRIFTQTNEMLRKLIFYCPLTWMPVVAG